MTTADSTTMTIRLPQDVKTKLIELAAKSGQSVNAYTAAVLQKHVEAQEPKQAPKEVRTEKAVQPKPQPKQAQERKEPLTDSGRKLQAILDAMTARTNAYKDANDDFERMLSQDPDLAAGYERFKKRNGL